MNEKGSIDDLTHLLSPAQQPGSLWLNKITTRNDTFTRLHEDPMMLIKKNEKEVSSLPSLLAPLTSTRLERMW
jgi:hypothetical protein